MGCAFSVVIMNFSTVETTSVTYPRLQQSASYYYLISERLVRFLGLLALVGFIGFLIFDVIIWVAGLVELCSKSSKGDQRRTKEL
jgi:hypothetical protein